MVICVTGCSGTGTDDVHAMDDYGNYANDGVSQQCTRLSKNIGWVV